uniref:Uncharacterized protein n=1 Tax=Arundo donax TaxID=35708 RepID=A0A0A9BK25_ARUDO
MISHHLTNQLGQACRPHMHNAPPLDGFRTAMTWYSRSPGPSWLIQHGCIREAATRM